MINRRPSTVGCVSRLFHGLRQPTLGRAITEEDVTAWRGACRRSQLSFGHERYGANPAAIGKQLLLNKQSFTIIGVTPPINFTGTLQVDYQPAVTISWPPTTGVARKK